MQLGKFDPKKTCVEYDRPSPLVGQFGDARFDRAAASLDRKLEDFIAPAAK